MRTNIPIKSNKKVSALSRYWLFVVLWIVTSIANTNLQAENEIQG
jgi:hypothetical protein